MPLVLGVTGSIATGKSSLCRYLVERHGAIHADADRVVHRMYDPGRPGFDRVVAEFGTDIVGADGFIDRRILGGLVFGNRQRMRALTAAIGDIKGEIRGVIEEWRATLPRDAIAVIEVVHLLEDRYAAWCDQTWLVAVEDSVAAERLMARNALTAAEAEQRLASAVPWEKRAPAVDRIFMNSGSPEAFEREIDHALEETVAAHRAGTLGESQYVRWQRAAEAAGGAGG